MRNFGKKSAVLQAGVFMMNTDTEIQGREADYNDIDLFDQQISKTLKSQFNLAARRRIEDLEEEKALRKLMDDELF